MQTLKFPCCQMVNPEEPQLDFNQNVTLMYQCWYKADILINLHFQAEIRKLIVS